MEALTCVWGRKHRAGDKIRPGVTFMLVGAKAWTGNATDSIITAAHTQHAAGRIIVMLAAALHTATFSFYSNFLLVGVTNMTKQKLTGFVLAGNFTFHSENCVY